MDAEELIESIIRALMFLAGILGNNWLALRSIPGERSAIRTGEVLFINLAVSNLITNFLVDLPDTMADIAGQWFLGETYCGVFRFSADLSETSSIFTTFFISVFWHQKLVGSLKRGGAPVRLDNLGLVARMLAGSWTVALVFSIPHFFFVTLTVDNGSHKDCIDLFPSAVSRQTYDILYLTLANALPLAAIVFASVQIVITLLQNRRRIGQRRPAPSREASGKDVRPREEGLSPASGSGVYTGAAPPSPGTQPGSAEDRRAGTQAGPDAQVRAAKSVVAVASVFLVCWLTHLFLRITNNIHTSSLLVEVASYIAASYTCIIPYIFLYGVKKLSCSCRQ